MFKYIIKRLLLMIPTFMAATFIVFLIINLVPGGPFERAVMQIKAAKMGGGGEGGGGSNTSKGSGSESLSAERLEQLKKQFGLDSPFYCVT
jgi:microcin C transport system permease protein